MKKYPLAKPFITKSEERLVLEVLRSGHLGLGAKYIEFEKKFARKIGTKYACSVSSGTAGLHLVMLAAGIGPGDEVITSPFSFIASSNSVLYVGAKPIFVDIDATTYNMDPAEIEKKITKKTKAILVVHIFGQSADMDPIIKIAQRYNLKIIEDACESVCAKYKSRNVGTFGESAVFAFYPNKQMTTGEGGMIVTNNERIYKLCASLRNQGRAENMNWLDHKYLGYNYRLDEMSAGMGIAQLTKLDFMIKKRREIARWYSEALTPYKNLISVPRIDPKNTHTWFVYVIEIKKTGVSRDQVINNLIKKNISSKAYLPSIHLFSFYRKQFGYKKGNFPVSERVSKNSLALPFYIGLKKADIEQIVRALIKIIR